MSASKPNAYEMGLAASVRLQGNWTEAIAQLLADYRAELAAENARWVRRIKTLEAQLERISAVAAGREP